MNSLVNTNELRAERVRQGKSSNYMAKVIGKGQGSYGKKEAGRVVFLPDEMLAVATDLSLSPAQFNLFFFSNKLPFGKNEAGV